MKRTELEKLKGKKLDGALFQGGTPHRFAQGSTQMVDRREQRRRDQALGLVPFAVKLEGELVGELHALAQARALGLNELVAQLLRKGMQDP